jgi:hypothetical protein
VNGSTGSSKNIGLSFGKFFLASCSSNPRSALISRIESMPNLPAGVVGVDPNDIVMAGANRLSSAPSQLPIAAYRASASPYCVGVICNFAQNAFEQVIKLGVE